jgi:hypothetical protein
MSEAIYKAARHQREISKLSDRGRETAGIIGGSAAGIAGGTAGVTGLALQDLGRQINDREISRASRFAGTNKGFAAIMGGSSAVGGLAGLLAAKGANARRRRKKAESVEASKALSEEAYRVFAHAKRPGFGVTPPPKMKKPRKNKYGALFMDERAPQTTLRQVRPPGTAPEGMVETKRKVEATSPTGKQEGFRTFLDRREAVASAPGPGRQYAQLSNKRYREGLARHEAVRTGQLPRRVQLTPAQRHVPRWNG